MKLNLEDEARGVGTPHVKLSGSMSKLVSLSKFLSSRVYDGTKQERDAGMIVVSAMGGSIWVTLKEPTAKLKATFQVDEPDKLWHLIDAWLGQDNPPWVVDPWARPRVNLKPTKKA